MPLLAVLRKSPFLRLLVFYAAGIATGRSFGFHWTTTAEIAIAITILWLVLLFIGVYYRTYHTGWVSGTLSSLTLFLCGIWSAELQSGEAAGANAIPLSRQVYRIRIMDLPDERESCIKATAKVLALKTGDRWKKQSFRILVYLAGSDPAGSHRLNFKKAKLQTSNSPQSIDPGKELLINASLIPVPGPSNPGEFDYKSYLATRHIYRQAFVKPGCWIVSGVNRRSLRSVSCLMRRQLLQSFKKMGLDNPDYGLLSALTLGYKEDVDSRTKQVFSRAGVMHIMALSGFNVGIIALVLGFILGFFEINEIGQTGKTVFIILILWMFALVTGLSPSVTRATLMISLLMAGRLFHRTVNTYNILSVSAFWLLALSPGMLTDVSFQLSIAAVAGIILYQPFLYNLISFKNGLIRKIWQLFTLTCAAQLATFPLTLYYFHQFPVYFWLTNLYAVPLVSLIVCITGIYLVFSFIKPLVILFGKILALLLKVLFFSVAVVEDLPFSQISGINVGKAQAAILIMMLLMLALFCVFRKMRWLLGFMTMVVILISINTIHAAKVNRQQIYMVGKLRNESAISLISGRHAILLLSSGRPPDDLQLKYALGDFFLKHGVKPAIYPMDSTKSLVRQASIMPGLHFRGGWRGSNYLVSLGSKRMIILRDDQFYRYHAQKPIITDILVISNGLSFKPQRIVQELMPSVVILDSSMKGSRAGQWMKTLRKEGIRCHSVIENGAYVAHALPDNYR